MTYAYSDDKLTALINDVTVPIEDVIREVERLCTREAHAAQYYRDNPHLVFRGHPWLRFVASGGAEYLGWNIGEAEGSSNTTHSKHVGLSTIDSLFRAYS